MRRVAKLQRGILAHTRTVKIIHRICERFRSRKWVLPEGADRAERGRYGEDLAADFCRRDLGYKLLMRNWSHNRDEIDLICRDGEVLVFIEVRSRADSALISGFHSVDNRKKKALLRVSKSYLRQLQNPPKHFRFDIIDIALTNGERGSVRHYANVPLFTKHYQSGT